MDNMLWVLWDLTAVLVLGACIYRCARRGFLRTIVSFIGYMAAALLSSFLSSVLARWTYDAVVRDLIKAMLNRRMEEALVSGGTVVAGVLSEVPGWMRNLMQAGGTELPAGIDAANTLEALIDMALADPVISILRAVFFFILFAVFSMLARRMSYLFTGVNRLPIIGVVNTFLGGVLGVLQGMLVLYLAAVAVRLVLVLSAADGALLSEATVTGGFIFRFFYRLSG